jgi:hypothetical protein
MGWAMAGVFICYAREDEQFVGRLYDALRSSGWEPNWEHDATGAGGTSWREEINKAILSSDEFIYVISPESLAAALCNEELSYACSVGKQIVPILRRTPPERRAIPPAIAELNWVSFNEDAQFDHSLELLNSALATDLDWIHFHTRLLVAASEWDTSGRDVSFLLRGSQLRAAEAWLENAAGREKPRPTVLQREYISVSRRLERRRQRLVTTSITVTLCLALLTSILGAISVGQARLNERALVEQLKTRPTVTVTASTEAQPTVTATERVTALPQPAVTVTDRVTASSRPTPTVTQFIPVASGGSGSDWSGGIAAIGTCIAGIGTAAAGYAAIATAKRKREPTKARRTYSRRVPRR